MYWNYFFIKNLAAKRTTLTTDEGAASLNLIFITGSSGFAGSKTTNKCKVGFETGTNRSWVQRIISLHHKSYCYYCYRFNAYCPKMIRHTYSGTLSWDVILLILGRYPLRGYYKHCYCCYRYHCEYCYQTPMEEWQRFPNPPIL